MIIMRLHDERWWKCGRYQTLCMDDMQPWALKPSHTMKACVLSNHAKFRHIQAQVEGISTLAPFTAHRVPSVDDISDGRVGRRSMTFQVSFNKDSINGNEQWWQWECMMKLYANVDDLKYYVGISGILEPWNPRIPSRHVPSLTMSNFDAYVQG